MKTRAWLALVIALVGYVMVWSTLRPATFAGRNSDFGCFYRAGRMVLAGEGARVYHLKAEQDFDKELGMQSFDGAGGFVSLPFVFAPFSLTWFTPLACLDYAEAEFAWYVVTVAMLLAVPLLLRRRAARSSYLACCWIAPLLFFPVILSLLQGQASVLLLLLFAAAYADLRAGRDYRTGCWLALAAFKPQFVLPMLLALLLWRKWKSLLSFALASAGLFGVSAVFVGWDAALNYPLALLQYSGMAHTSAGEHPESMANLRGLLDQVFRGHLSASALAVVTLATSLVVLSAMMLALRRRSVSETSFSLAVVVSVLVSYHAYLHDACLLLLPILLLFPTLLSKPCAAISSIQWLSMVTIFLAPLLPISLGYTALVITVASAALGITLTVNLWGQQANGLHSAPAKLTTYPKRVAIAG